MKYSLGEQISFGTRWTVLRVISNVRIVKFTIFIPVLGYWILFNDKLLNYLHLSPLVTNVEEAAASIPANLLCVYFGLCLIAVASFLYQLFCPDEIKEYPSTIAYIAGDKEHITAFRKDHIEDVLNNLEDGVENKEAFLYAKQMYEGQYYTLVEYIKAILNVHFSHLMITRIFALILIALFYAGGFIFLAIPSLKIFLKVVILLFEAINS